MFDHLLKKIRNSSNVSGCCAVSDLTTFLSSGPLIAMELQAENGIKRWADMAGPTDPSVARQVAPASFRARFGTGKTLRVEWTFT